MHWKQRFTCNSNIVSVVIFALFLANTADAAVWHVDHSVTSSGDGSDWSEAFKTLDEALNNFSLVSGDEIWLANDPSNSAKYFADEGGTSGDRIETFLIDLEIRIYGGFDGTELDKNDRDATANPTYLSGNIDDDTGDDSGDSHHVVTIDLIDGSADQGIGPFLDSVIIEYGNANGGGTGSNRYGGGVRVFTSNSVFSECIIEHSTGDGGGGVYFEGDNPGFPQNEYNFNWVVNTIFRNNSSDGVAGALLMYRPYVYINNSLFHDNSADTNGGAIDVAHSGVANSPTVLTMTNSTLADNDASSDGGGIYVNEFKTDADIANCIFWGNSAGNSSTTEREQIDSGASDLSDVIMARYSDIEGISDLAHTSNIDDDPLFDANYRLTNGSPAIDAGDDGQFNTLGIVDVSDLDRDGITGEDPPRDLDLRIRVLNNAVEMGAFEWQACTSDVNGDGTVDVEDLLIMLGEWGSCPTDCYSDTNGDDTVDVNDLLTLLANWGDNCAGDDVPETIEDCMTKYGVGTAACEACIQALELSGN